MVARSVAFHLLRTAGRRLAFEAAIAGVTDDGRLQLRTAEGTLLPPLLSRKLRRCCNLGSNESDVNDSTAAYMLRITSSECSESMDAMCSL